MSNISSKAYSIWEKSIFRPCKKQSLLRRKAELYIFNIFWHSDFAVSNICASWDFKTMDGFPANVISYFVCPCIGNLI